MSNISICTGQSPFPPHFYASALADLWVERGMTVEIGSTYRDDADLCMLHINRTRIDPATLPPAPGEARVVNGGVLDISKRAFSTIEVLQGDDWSGPVIVKTNLNHFGIPETLGAQSDEFTQRRKRLAQKSWRHARMLPERTYPVLPDQMAVPQWVWRSEDYIVEKFLPEREGDLYALRGWVFLGNRGYGWRIVGRDPMVKVSGMVSSEYITDVPDEIREWRRRSSFDFGKFDYVMHGDKAILFDMNKTPTFAATNRRSERLVDLSYGIEDFLP
jgi:hypothetical protein